MSQLQLLVQIYISPSIIMSNSTGLTGLLPTPHGNASLLADPGMLLSLALNVRRLLSAPCVPANPKNPLLFLDFLRGGEHAISPFFKSLPPSPPPNPKVQVNLHF